MKKFLIMCFVALAAGFQSCDNNDDLWAAIDDLKGRVQALETQVEALNGNVEALKQLYSGKTITEVVQKDGVYTLTLSDGTTIELTQGSTAEATIPVIGIDADGYWQVSYDGGKTFERLDVKATATDGVTPKFRIEETTGYWQVSYDGGTEYTNVLDTAGNPVSAVGSGTVTDKFFDTVEVKDGMFYVKLLDGTELNIPILSDFYCRITLPTPGMQSFSAEQTRTFEVEIKGADNIIVTAPQGWSASLSEPSGDKATLTVTAPAATTRASADNTKDVSILVTAGSYATLAKMQVELSATVPAPTATVVISAGSTPTASSLSFDISTTNADGWAYLCLKSTESAPSVTKVLANGTEGTGAGSHVIVSGLEAGTKYTIYVVAYADGVYSALASVEDTTAAPAAIDYYKTGITIDGVLFKEGLDGAQLVTTTTTITQTSGVYFLDPAPGAVIDVVGNNANGFDKLVIIGRYSNAKPTLRVTNYMSLNAKAAGFGFVFKNVVVDGTGMTKANYLFNSEGSTAAGICERFIIEDCTVISAPDVAFTYFSGAASVKKTLFRNNRFQYMATTATNKKLLDYANAGAVANLVSVEFSNNIIYAPANVPKLALFTTTNAANTNLNVVMRNNTIVNCPGSNGYVQVGNIASVTMEKNIIWFTESVSCYLCKFQAMTTGVGSVEDNKAYSKNVSGYITNGAFLPSNISVNPILTAETSDPFDGGTFNLATGQFVPNATYAGYGADLK